MEVGGGLNPEEAAAAAAASYSFGMTAGELAKRIVACHKFVTLSPLALWVNNAALPFKAL